ncbi:MAG: chemotaxis protein CheA [Hahellaceae bacterium]|nr:chemotaxis protein CheA [Hahellaceae bacterium]MCP5168388.1 chemotaxis protein CheA [Hahellaceae bacterium]
MNFSDSLNTYFEESHDLLTQMEDILLGAEGRVPDSEEMNALFRCAHTIKGSGGMLGLSGVVSFTHEVESLLDRLRNAELMFTPALAQLLLECRDQIESLVRAEAEGTAVDEALGETLIQKLHAHNHPDQAQQTTQPAAAVETTAALANGEPREGQVESDCWHVSLRFDHDLLMYGLDPLSLIDFLNTLGDVVHVETLYDDLPDFFAMNPEDCYFGFEIALRSSASKSDIEATFEFVADQARITILPPHSLIQDYFDLMENAQEARARIGELLVACGSITENELSRALDTQHSGIAEPIGELLIAQKSVQKSDVDLALARQKEGDERRAREAKSVKVPADRLDALIDQVGELVIAGAATELLAQKTLNTDLQESTSHLLSLVEEIRDTALRLRMTPIGDVFARFPRVVRDVSKELGKDIRLEISGAEAELDKSMIEKIGDPLMHLVRNSIDHGIESPEQRKAAGKPEQGVLKLNAYHVSGSIVIEVQDDGAGLNSEKIFQKAVSKGLVADDAHLSKHDIYRLILEPGFSTASAVTNLSGRGVGMDVVKSNVEALRGTLDIDSVPGQGTMMRIYLPLTLAIIDGFKVGIGYSTFILPLECVIECIELPEGVKGADYLNLRGEVLPYLRLRQLFNVAGRSPVRQNIVVVGFAGRKIGIVVDHLQGECQTVIKSLGPLFSGVSGISGSTILGSGEVALILDVAQLIQRAMHAENQHVPA